MYSLSKSRNNFLLHVSVDHHTSSTPSVQKYLSSKWMKNWNDIMVEDRSEEETRFCYFHQHSCANFQSVTLEKVYPSSAIKSSDLLGS